MLAIGFATAVLSQTPVTLETFYRKANNRVALASYIRALVNGY